MCCGLLPYRALHDAAKNNIVGNHYFQAKDSFTLWWCLHAPVQRHNAKRDLLKLPKRKTFEFFVHQFLGIFLLARADSGEKATKLLVILLVEQKVSML